MRVSKWSRSIIAAIILLSACVVFAFFLLRDDCLIAESRGIALLVWPISAGECFEVTYTHSLNLSSVTDIIEWTGRDMVVVKSVFKTFGAGIPVPADWIGSELLFTGDHYELIGIDKHMQGFSIITQQVPNHKITFNEREAFLLDIAESGTPITITVKRLTFIQRLMASG